MRPQPGEGEQRRSRIGEQAPAGIVSGNRLEIGREQLADLGAELRRKQAADALAPFAGSARFPPGQTGQAGSGVGVDDAERAVLFPQMRDDAREHRVFDDVGEIAGMERVAVVHRRGRTTEESRRGYSEVGGKRESRVQPASRHAGSA